MGRAAPPAARPCVPRFQLDHGKKHRLPEERAAAIALEILAVKLEKRVFVRRRAVTGPVADMHTPHFALGDFRDGEAAAQAFPPDLQQATESVFFLSREFHNNNPPLKNTELQFCSFCHQIWGPGRLPHQLDSSSRNALHAAHGLFHAAWN